MIVVVLTDCPPKLRGDLSKWLCEINTGVYVGNLNARVRDDLWLRICENLKNGQATMVYSSGGEQHMEFRVHHTSWECVDFDGIQLMRRPLPTSRVQNPREQAEFVSKAGARRKIHKIEQARQLKMDSEDYTVVDLETTGLMPGLDEIMEIAAIKVSNGKILSEVSELLHIDKKLPQHVQELTGITPEILASQGKDPKDTLAKFLQYVGGDRVVGHNVAFDVAFIRAGCKKYGLEQFNNLEVDTRQIAHQRVPQLKNYQLQTVAEQLGIQVNRMHRALDDCKTTLKIYHKMMEKEEDSE